MTLGADDIDELREICGDDDLHFEMTRSLISVERRFRTMARRAKLYDTLESTIRRSFYEDEEDAVGRARELQAARLLRKGKLAEEASPPTGTGKQPIVQGVLIQGDSDATP